MAAYVVERVIGLRERGGNGSRATTLFRKMKGKERKGGKRRRRRRRRRRRMEEMMM